MFALRGDDLANTLHDPSLHAALSAAGADRCQVNVDDEQVAPAMRIPSSEHPIKAIVSVWTSGDAERVVEVLSARLEGRAERLAGWEVDERRPIDPPEAWDGTRGDGLANIALLRRPAELSQEEWLERWLVDHTPIAMATQATFGYLQNVVVRAVTADAPPISALVEELFPIEGMSDMHAFYGSGGDDGVLHDRLSRLMTSVARIGADRDLDLVPTSRYLYSLT